ncbi:hypothetical protein ACEPAG_7572 [Sanghuangporus baumii]
MAEDARERERMEARSHGGSPETHRSASAILVGPSRSVLPPPPTSAASTSEYPVPYPPPNAAESSDRRRGRKTGKETDTMGVRGPPTPAPGSAGSSAGSQSSDKRKRRTGGRRGKDGSDSTAGSHAPSVQPGSFRVAPIPPNSGSIKSPPSPEPKSSASASGSSGRSSRPSPIGNVRAADLPRREVDEDYYGVAESLMSLATSGGSAPLAVSPTVSVGGRMRQSSANRINQRPCSSCQMRRKKERYAMNKPMLEEVEKILAEAGLDESEIKRGVAACPRLTQGESRNQR